MWQVRCFLTFLYLTSTKPIPIYQKITCSLNVDEDLIKINQPLMIITDGDSYRLLTPEKIQKNSLINILHDEQVLLFCPGNRNKLKILQQDSTVTTCKANKLQVENDPRKIKNTNEFQCTSQLEPTLKKTEEQCAEGIAQIFQAGYQINELSKFFPLLTICHDIKNMNTLYSTYKLIGKSIDARQKNVPRPPEFFVGNLKELFGGISPNQFYTKINAMIRFQQIFITAWVTDYVDLKTKYLSRGHLSPDADMLLSSWKITTYFFINVAPQWQDINSGNWLKVENLVRKAAAWLADDLTIITGTYGILKLQIGTEEKEIYLAPDNKLKVSEYFWKIIYHETSQTAIVIITSNNPYIKHITPFCADICSKQYWQFNEMHNYQKGYTYCCTYEDFKNIVNYAPILTVQGTFKMPKKPPFWTLQSGIKKVIHQVKQRRRSKGGN